MKTHPLLLALTLTLGALFATQSTAAPGDNAVKKELVKLRGTWKLVKELEAGKEFPVTEEETFEIAAGTLVNKIKGKVVDEMTFKFDPAKMPKTIDLTLTTGQDKGMTLAGIYTLEGDVLTLSLGLPNDGKRPTDFTSNETNKSLVLTLKRMK